MAVLSCGVICLVNSVNERDLSLLNRCAILEWYSFLEDNGCLDMEV